ncbi:unnamed protein product [Lymnaea stagnalis]|uniref:Uncharacterized protein n=1 Tax=Lymnaea stagnalis TaxID=6523 RepID=A0AAV2IPZ3_LYMST
MRYTKRTTEPNYDGAGRNTRWAFKPMRTYFAKNNEVKVQGPYTTINVPSDLYTLLHFRYCKKTWRGCKERARTEDTVMLKYERQLRENLLKLPLDDILHNNTGYVRHLKKWKETGRANHNGRS